MPKSKLPRDDEALTTRQLVEFHRTKERARADAERGLLAAKENKDIPPPALAELREAIDARAGGRQRTWLERRDLLEDAIAASSGAAHGDIKTFAAEVEAEVSQTFADLEPETRRRIQEEAGAKVTYQAWRDMKKLYREPGGAPAKLAYFAPVAVSTLTEASLQSWMFQEATSAGLLGALAVAIGVSASTAAIGILSGAIPTRALNEKAWWARALGFAGVIAGALLLLAVNWGAAKFRDISAAGGDIEGALLVAKLIAADWNLTVPGLAVFCIGVANGIYCWVKGYRAFDPIIGFERQARAYRDKVDAVDELEANLDGRLSQILNRTIGYGRNRPLAITAELQNQKKEVTALEIAKRRNIALDDSDVQALSGAIEAYRATYKYVSKTSPQSLSGDIQVSQHKRDYVSLDNLGVSIEKAVEAQAAQAEQWVKGVDTVAEIVGDVKEARSAILQAIAKQDPSEGSVAELKAVRERFLAVGKATEEGSEDWSEPWEEKKKVSA